MFLLSFPLSPVMQNDIDDYLKSLILLSKTPTDKYVQNFQKASS